MICTLAMKGRCSGFNWMIVKHSWKDEAEYISTAVSKLNRTLFKDYLTYYVDVSGTNLAGITVEDASRLIPAFSDIRNGCTYAGKGDDLRDRFGFTLDSWKYAVGGDTMISMSLGSNSSRSVQKKVREFICSRLIPDIYKAMIMQDVSGQGLETAEA